jgi:hypothetical protein
MKPIQLALDFKSAIALALAEPEVADLRQLWRSLEPELLGLTRKEQLQVAGQALCDLAEVCQRRAELMWNEWQDSHNTEGPIPDDDFLAGLVQKTMFLDISGLVRQPKSRKVTGDDVEEEGDSVVEEVTKEVALLLAGAEEEDEPIPVMVLEHDEDVGAWAAIVREWMVANNCKCGSIGEVVNSTRLSSVQVWIAGLLSDFELERMSRKDKDFYDAEQLIIRTEIFTQREVA